jgi:cyclooctatin synthase
MATGGEGLPALAATRWPYQTGYSRGDRWATDYSRSDMRATFFPFGQGIRNCIGEGFAWTESTLLLSAIAARWQLRLAGGAAVHPVVSSTLVPSELPIIVTRRR